jgi:hypothetical protein
VHPADRHNHPYRELRGTDLQPRPNVPQDGHRRYHHRWVVPMHKVRQWYPSQGVHKIIWHGPYIKGPANAPLLTGLADRRDTVTAALHIQPRSALRYLDTEAIRELTASIAAAVTPPPTPLDDLNPDAPVNAVHCAHYEPAADSLPALHLTPAGYLGRDAQYLATP